MVHIVILYSAVYSLGYDGSLLNGLQAIPAWVQDFGKPAGTRLGLIAASYYLPKIPATFVIAWLIDRFGRKIALYFGALFMLAGSLSGGFCHSTAQLLGSRILLGIGTAAAQIAACALVPELAHPRLRHQAGGFLNTTYYIGSIFSAWLTFSMIFFPNGSSWSWRIPTLVQGLGPIVLAAGTYFIPESPRWLIKQGKKDSGHAILAKYHANGKLDDELVLLELREIQVSIEIEKLSKKTGWTAFFASPGNIKRFCVIIMMGTATQWVGNGVVQYYLVPVLKQVGITKPAQTTGINGGLAICNWFSAMLGASLVERFGRRPLFLSSLIAMLGCFIVMTGVSGGYATTENTGTGLAMVPFIFLFSISYSLAFTPLPMLYVPEISTLTLRAKSAALLLLSQNCAQSFNQFVNPVALAAIKWKYYFVYDAVLVIYIILFFWLVKETRGLTVEEAATVYDPDELKATQIMEEKHMHVLLRSVSSEGSHNKGTVDDEEKGNGSETKINVS